MVHLTPSPVRVLVADPEAACRRDLARALVERGQEVLTAESGEAAIALARSATIDVALVGATLTAGGVTLLEGLRRLASPPEVIALTAAGGAQAGLLDHAGGILEKGPTLGVRAVALIQQAGERRRLRDEVERLRGSAASPELLGQNRHFRRALTQARQAAALPLPLHLSGEPGTGKEHLARSVHGWGREARGPFVVLGARGLEAAAFEGSPLVDQAAGGTLYIDEVDQLTASAQRALDRYLQTAGHARLITACAGSLYAAMKAGSFRGDLFARLTPVSILLVPLRQRRDDIPLLADHFLRQAAQRTGAPARRVSPEAMRQLRAQSWPNNLDELCSVVERAVILSQKETLFPGDLSPATPDPPTDTEATMTNKNDFSGLSLPPGWDELPYADAKERALDSFHAAYLGVLLRRTGGNISEAARRAGLDRSNFRRVLKRYGNPLAPKPVAAGETK